MTDLISDVHSYIIENDLDTNSRKRESAYQRWYLYEFLKNNTFLTLEEIGKLFDRDHSTVLHGLKEFQKFKDDEQFFYTCYKVHKRFPMKFTSIYNVSIGSLSLTPRSWKKLKTMKQRSGCATYSETLEKYLIKML